MNAVLLDLTLRGTIATLAVLGLDWALTHRMRPRWRRMWWLLVALAWLVPVRLPWFAAVAPLPVPALSFPDFARTGAGSRDSAPLAAVSIDFSWTQALAVVWAAGALLALGILLLRTWRAARRWNPLRLCTAPELLELLEDCKAAARVTAPVGLVLSRDITTPALLGWFRPRILLPAELPEAISRDQLRGILLHELAHFRSADIQLAWLFALAQALHWFNPFVHLAALRWRRYRELAADATALDWMPAGQRDAYGDALVSAVRHSNEMPVPQGALALGESLEHLRERIALVATGSARCSLTWMAVGVAGALVLFILLPPRAASTPAATVEPAAAVAAAEPVMRNWMALLDARRFDDCWGTMSGRTKQQMREEDWKSTAAKVLSLFGKPERRTMVRSQYRNDLGKRAGMIIPGEFVEFHFDTSYEKMPEAVEACLVTRDTDDHWRVFSYAINPR